jgi:uroporphyrin-III C-methyltransferase/precorrin-2 dehydrogenase/sirohydrochlorin ferrochelatase
VSELYPLGLKLEGKTVLVVGGGSVATRRIPALLNAGARIILVSPQITPALQGIAEAGRIEWRQRRFESQDLDNVWLIQVAVNDKEAANHISGLAEIQKIFCVRADDRHAATAWTPAVTRQGSVTVAVLAGGDPRKAMKTRDRLAEVLASDESTVEENLGGTVALVGGGPGDPELITVKGRRLLAKADVVVADRLGPGILLDELRPETELIDVAKLPYGPAAAQEEINRLLIDRARAGKMVVRLKGGDPFVFGRGGEEVQACAAAGIPVTVVPGISSSIAVPGVAGIPVTHRGVAHEFTVVTGHLVPGAPGSLVNWGALAQLRGTLVILMGLKNLSSIVDTLIAHGRDPRTPAAIVQEGTTQHQHLVPATLATLPAMSQGIRPPAIIVVGDVASVLR